MIRKVDHFLDRITMYRLVLYGLILLIIAAGVLSLFHLLPFQAWAVLISALVFTALGFILNFIFSKLFRAVPNVESFYITALILSLIITPPASFQDLHFFIIASLASLFAIGSKYILAFKRKHLFNPAAIGVVMTALLFHLYASWWVGSPYMLPLVLLIGALIIRKIRRADLFWSFLIAALIAILIYNLQAQNFLLNFWNTLIYTPLLFFAFVMMTEPQTTPPRRNLRIFYGAIVGVFFSPAIHFGSIYSTPELALVIGNIFSYIVSPKEKLLLVLKEKIKVARDTYNFIFAQSHRMKFQPGQYLEWTLAPAASDSRGNRRYFTIASSPTEEDLIMGVKFYPEPSTFKRSLLSLEKGQSIMAGSRAGDFVLPEDKNEKLAFIAGGIGITPFRSMIKYLLDTNEKRPITIFYSNRRPEDIAYTDILELAEKKLGIKTVYTVTEEPPPDWPGEKGLINEEMIGREIPDFKERTFYLSGPQPMIVAFDQLLRKMGVSEFRIKKDFFPGYS